MNAGYVLSRLIRRGLKRQPLNASTEIRLTRLCSQRCRQCSVYERKTDPPCMTLEQFRLICQRLKEYGAFVGFISGGEATLVPDLDQMLMEAKKTFQLSTTLVTGLYNRSDVIHRIGRLALDQNIHIQTSLDGLGELGDDLRGVKDFSETVLKHMQWIAFNRGNSKSILYANIVLNNRNLDQVPELIKRIRDLGWKATIGMYHTLTQTTRSDDALRLRPSSRLDNLLAFLDNNPDILNLNSYIEGISDFVAGKPPGICAFLDAPVLTTRTTVMEDGAVHLCYGDPIGNIFDEPFLNIFTGSKYHRRLEEYRACHGCWTTCYTQRYLLVHPRSVKEIASNIRKLLTLGK